MPAPKPAPKPLELYSAVVARVNTTCPAHINYRLRIQARIQRWQEGSLSKTPGKTRRLGVPWQALVNNKFIGYAFAMALGVRTPQQYACPQTLAEVPARWPAHWANFVVKPLSGSTANGVNIVRSGINEWTGQRVRVLT